jgi:hypothetical protein
MSVQSREVDRYLSAYYRATLGMCQRFHAFDCYDTETDAIGYVLKSCPRDIYRRLKTGITQYCDVSFEIKGEMDALLSIRRVAAVLPFDPSWFVSRVERLRTSAATRQFNAAIDVAAKQFRADFNQSNGRLN